MLSVIRDRIKAAREGHYVNAFLFVCSANLIRSPTAEHVARLRGLAADSAGSEARAHPVRPLTLEAIERAEVIVCMEAHHEEAVLRLAPHRADDVQVWHVLDSYDYCDPQLFKLLGHLVDALIRVRASSERLSVF